jgi:formylglycine-generating enzyme required for sulfatase activity
MRSIRCSCSALLFLCAFPLFAQTDAPGMPLIPEGPFWMGRVHFFLVDAIGWFERDRQDDFPAHRVTLSAFYIDKYEVTNAEYLKFLDAKGGVKPWHWPGGKIPAGEDKLPAYNVDWNEANAYCGWLGKRLPTEAEWEKAARGGLDRKKFAWGDASGGAGESAVTQGSGRGAQRAKPPANFNSKRAVEVGMFPPNGYGLFDMTGNVWEWTNDWYDRNYYSISPLKDPAGPKTGMYKVFRGGGWNDADERNLMPSFRNYTDPLEKSITIGFRCAKSTN